ncbi:MAG: GTP-binding protein [Candidatus Woesearchaeota archaeon]
MTKLSRNENFLSLSIWNKKHENYHDSSNFDFLNSYSWDTKYEIFDFIELIDIPGFDGSYNQNIIDFLDNFYYNIVFFVLDISKGFKKQSLEILNKLKSKNPQILFLINKTDMVIEDSSIDEIDSIIKDIKSKVEQNIDSKSILGYLPISSKHTGKKYIKTLQDILILTSYVSIYKLINYLKFDNYLNELLNYNNRILSFHKNLTEYYLNNLYRNLYNTSNMDLLFSGKETIEEIINFLNNQLESYMIEIIYEYKDDIRKYTDDFLDSLDKIMITYLDIVNFNDENDIINNYNPLIYGNININVSSLNSSLDNAVETILQTIGMAFLAKLSIGVLFPGIGTLIAIGLAIWNASSKAQEIREKVYQEVSYKLPTIVYEEWFKLVSNIYEKQKEIILNLEKELYKISEKLIENIKEINNNLSKELLNDIRKINKWNWAQVINNVCTRIMLFFDKLKIL